MIFSLSSISFDFFLPAPMPKATSSVLILECYLCLSGFSVDDMDLLLIGMSCASRLDFLEVGGYNKQCQAIRYFENNRRKFQIKAIHLFSEGGYFSSCTTFIPQAQENCKKIAAKGIPFVATVSKQDRVMQWHIGLDTARMCGLPESNISYLDSSGELLEGPDIGDLYYLHTFICLCNSFVIVTIDRVLLL